MKKGIIIFAMLVLVGSFAFAKASISAAFNPVSMQAILTSGKDNIFAKYGIGGSLGADYQFKNGIDVGADLTVHCFFLKGRDNFADVAMIAKAGYNFKLSKSVGAFVHAKEGLTIHAADKKASVGNNFGIDLGIRVFFNKHFSLFVEGEELFDFTKIDNAKGMKLVVNSFIGATYTF